MHMAELFLKTSDAPFPSLMDMRSVHETYFPVHMRTCLNCAFMEVISAGQMLTYMHWKLLIFQLQTASVSVGATSFQPKQKNSAASITPPVTKLSYNKWEHFSAGMQTHSLAGIGTHFQLDLELENLSRWKVSSSRKIFQLYY